MFESKKRVYCFGAKNAEGDGSMRELLGGKGVRANHTFSAYRYPW